MKKHVFVLFVLMAFFVSACPVVPNPIPATQVPTPLEDVADGKWSPTGFYWPTERGDPLNFGVDNWLYDSCPWSGNNNYTKDQYHVGLDIKGEETDKVFAIADGKVLTISHNGWGIGNIAILIEHKLADGRSFVAVYGHIKDDPNNDIHTGKVKDVRVAQVIGLMGPYTPSYPHLHLGIFEVKPGGPSMPTQHLGKMDCPETETDWDTNGFTSPYLWLTTQYPAPNNTGPIIAAPGGDGTDDFPEISATIISATVAPIEDPTEEITDPPDPIEKLATIAFGYSFELMLTFDENNWKSADLSNGYQAIELINASDCIMHQNFGMGAPDWWERDITQETIGKYVFRVEKWTDKNTNKIELLTYNIDELNLYIGIEPGATQSTCIEAAKEVINYSVEYNFGPF